MSITLETSFNRNCMPLVVWITTLVLDVEDINIVSLAMQIENLLKIPSSQLKTKNHINHLSKLTLPSTDHAIKYNSKQLNKLP